MQQFRNLSGSSTESNKLGKAKYNLNRLLLNRTADVYNFTGTYRGSEACYQVLVDWGKKKQFLEKCKTGSCDVTEYGKVLESARGYDTPQSFNDRLQQFIKDALENILVVKLQREQCEKTYYVVSYVGREKEIMDASSEEKIKRCGRILYSSTDEDPPESLAHVIEQEYFCLAEHGQIVDSKPFDAVRKGVFQEVTKYLEEGGDVNSTDKYGWTLMHHAAHCGNIKLIEFLKDKGANIHKEEKMCGRKPIHIAAKESHSSAIPFLLTNSASVNERDKNNWTPLHYAAWKGNLKTVRLLIQHGAEIHAEEASISKKPIHVAAEYGHTHIVEFFLENDATIEDDDESGKTPLFYAAWTGHLETAKFLINNGANITVKTKERKTILHAATLLNSKENLEFFLDAGLNIDEKDNKGLTPLHYASYRGCLNAVQVLVDRGADLFAEDTNGTTPLVFLENSHVNIVLYLTHKMGKKFQEQFKYSDAIKLYKDTLASVKEELGLEHHETLEIQNKIGTMLYELGQYDEAMDTFKDVLEKRERCLGSDHLDILSTKHGLGLVYSAQIKYSEALDILKEVFDTREISLGSDHDDTLSVFRDMAHVHFKKGEYEEAFEMFKDVVEKRNTHFGIDHPKALQARQDMAVVLVNKGEYKMALQIFKDILEKRKNVLGNNHPDTLSTLCHVTLISQKYEKEFQVKNSCSIM